jgi:TP901 family phage tail tape measure protein
MPTSVGNLWVDVRFDTSNLGADLRRSLSGAGAAAGDDVSASLSQRLTTLGTSLGNVGRQVSLGLSLPLIAFGKAASSAFTDFDTAMTQVTTLSGVAASTVRDWTDDVMDLGSTYGVSAGEAAKGLYFITSSGVAASDALGVLDVALKSSALGLGSVAVAADVVTSAMNQYGDENISAAQAADILTVAVRTGKGEADEMAGALARVIPLAGSMGVQFDEVSGIMSAMTLSGTSADEAATQINALLTSMQKMPKSAQENMKALTGLDYVTLQQDIRTKGLTQTLRTIYNAFGENTEAIGKVFGNVRALRGITNLFGEKEEQTLAVVEQTTHAFGAQEQAIKQLEASPAWQLKKAQTNFSNAMTNIGEMATPMLSAVVGGFAAVLGATQYLPGPVQTLTLGLAGLAAAAGPLLYVGSSVLRLAGNIGTGMTAIANLGVVQGVAIRVMYLNSALTAAAASGNKFAMAARFVGSAMGPLAVGVTTAVIAFQTLNAIIHANDEAFAELGRRGEQKVAATDSWKALNDEIDRANAGINQSNSELDALDKQLQGEVYGIVDLGLAKTRQEAMAAGEAFRTFGQAAVRARDQALAVSTQFGISRDAAAKWISAQATAGKTFGTTKDALDAYTKAQRENDASVQQATIDTERQKNSLAGIIATVKETSDAFFGVETALKGYEQAKKAIADADKKVVDAEKAHKDAIEDVAAAGRKVVEADQKVIESGKRVAESRQAAAEAQKRLNDLLAGPSPSERLDVRSARLSLREAQEAARKPGQTPLERERSSIGLERARLDLAEAERAHDEAIADARKDVKSATEGVADAEKSRQDAIAAAAESRTALQVARDKEHQSLLDIDVALDAVNQAHIDSLKPAMDLTAAQADLNTKFATGTIEAEAFHKYLSNLKGLYPELAGELQNYLDKFNELQAQNAKAPKTAGDLLGGSLAATERAGLPAAAPTPEELRRALGNTFGRATGGPVTGGQLYEVNERNTPEMLLSGGRQFLLPVDAGTVVPLHKGEGGGGPSLNVSAINVYGADQPVQTAYEIRRQLRSKRDLVGRR